VIVLGIDAAWTTTEPSGVALVTGDGSRWTCRGLAPSYRQFSDLASGREIDWTRRPLPGAINIDELIAATEALAGGTPDVIAVDMPLAFASISARRVSDTKISRLFGAAGAAVHSPSSVRPGPIADQLRVGLERRGYTLEVNLADPPRRFALIETYPHPITMWLCDACRRLPYKAAKSGKYWPTLPLAERRQRLLAVWQDIVLALGRTINGVTLPALNQVETANAGAQKAFEDGLDALICTIAGIHYMNGNALPYGDTTSAIWLPAGCETYAGRPNRYPAARSDGVRDAYAAAWRRR
jgi:predicted RNase H-like nuclease